MFERLVSVMVLYNILSDKQHGFRKKRSCESQLILTIQDLAAGLNSKSQVDAILLDFSKAYVVYQTVCCGSQRISLDG
jgi:hypothetical protein